MQPPRPARNYDALRETENEVRERLAEPAAESPERAVPDTPTAEAEIDDGEARLAAHEAMLQEKVDAGRISASEMVYQMRKFDNKLVVEMKVAELREARLLAAEARKEQAAEQSRGHELDGPER